MVVVPLAKPNYLVQLQGPELQQALPDLERGVCGLEVSAFASPQLLDGDWQRELEQWKALCRSVPGLISVHGPFLDLSPASPEPGLRRLTAKRYRQALAVAKALQASYLVLHTQYNPNLTQPDYSYIWEEASLRWFEQLLPEIEDAGVKVVLENVWDQTPEPLARLLDRLPPSRFGACLDAGHAHVYSTVPWSEWVDTLGERLTYLHLSDNHGTWDEHLALGQGNADILGLLSTLQSRNRYLPCVLELERWVDVEQSLQWLGWGNSTME